MPYILFLCFRAVDQEGHHVFNRVIACSPDVLRLLQDYDAIELMTLGIDPPNDEPGLYLWTGSPEDLEGLDEHRDREFEFFGLTEEQLRLLAETGRPVAD